MHNVEGIMMDWAGTAVDFGCFAPVNVFVRVFEEAGIDVTIEEARRPMGMLKIDHIRTMLQMPRISACWEASYGRPFEEKDVETLYARFEPKVMDTLKNFTDPIPDVVEAMNSLRQEGIKIGSTTGYTDEMLRVVVEEAAQKGYVVDSWVTPDSTYQKGRPYPYMIYHNMEKLGLSASWRCIKIGDTVADIQEGISAGLWTVGVCVGSSQMGLDEETYNALTDKEKSEIIQKTAEVFKEQGADFTITTLKALPALVNKIDQMIAEGKRPFGCK